MPKDSIFNVISINHDIISNFINIYMSHPKTKKTPRINTKQASKSSFEKNTYDWVTRVVGCHLLMLWVNLLCWGTSLLLRNKAEHDEDENWMRNSVFSFLFRFSMCWLRTRESRFSIDFFLLYFICFLSSYACLFAEINPEEMLSIGLYTLWSV